MGRYQPRNSADPGPPTGRAWAAFRRQLFAEHGGTPLCWHCQHPVLGPQRGEVQHLLSPRTHPQLAWARSNLKIVHAGGSKRCQVCDLSCQSISAGNLAPRDEMGRPLPFPPDFLAARIAERRAHVNRAGPRTRARAGEAQPRADVPREPVPAGRPQIDVSAGRAW
jgi:hypothetical protein